MVTLFSIGTLDNWTSDLQRILAQGKGISKSISMMFIVSFLIIITFIVLNLFVGLVIVVFRAQKNKRDGFKILDKHGQECVSLALRIKLQSGTPKQSYYQQKLWSALNSSNTEYCILMCVVLNSSILMTKSYNESKLMHTLQDSSNIFFTSLFTIELLLKVIALSPITFAKNIWCAMHALVVIGSWVDIVLHFFNASLYLHLSVLSLFQVLRIVRIISRKSKFRQIVKTFFRSLQSVPSIVFLLAMLIFIYAVLGMQVGSSFYN